MNMQDYYDFSLKYLDGALQAGMLNKDGNDEGDADKYTKLLYGRYEDIHFPVPFIQVYGEKLQDMLTSLSPFYLISTKMKNVIEANNLTGCKVFPIVLYNKKGEEIPGYHGFSITGTCGPVDYSKSAIIEKEYVNSFGKVIKQKCLKGLHVGLDAWDGSDFFMPQRSKHIIVTKRAMEAMTKNEFNDFRFENLVDLLRVGF